jgi:hypothetical protein
MIEKFAAGAEIREICDCRDRREKFTPVTQLPHARAKERTFLT